MVLLWGTARDVGRRLLDGVDPELVDRAERILLAADGIKAVRDVRLRWAGHPLGMSAAVAVEPETTVTDFHRLEELGAAALRHGLPGVGHISLSPTPAHQES